MSVGAQNPNWIPAFLDAKINFQSHNQEPLKAIRPWFWKLKSHQQFENQKTIVLIQV